MIIQKLRHSSLDTNVRPKTSVNIPIDHFFARHIDFVSPLGNQYSFSQFVLPNSQPTFVQMYTVPFAMLDKTELKLDVHK